MTLGKTNQLGNGCANKKNPCDVKHSYKRCILTYLIDMQVAIYFKFLTILLKRS